MTSPCQNPPPSAPAQGLGLAVSRDLLADATAFRVRNEGLDGLLAFDACDKTNPGPMLGMVAANVPAIYLYGGYSTGGLRGAKHPDGMGVVAGVGKVAAGTMTEDDLNDITRHSTATPGACGVLATANTMARVSEAMGISPADSSRRGPGMPEMLAVTAAIYGQGGKDTMLPMPPSDTTQYHQSMAMTLRLTEKQTAALREAAAADGMSMHEAVLRAVDDYTSRRERLRNELLDHIVNRDREALDRLANL